MEKAKEIVDMMEQYEAIVKNIETDYPIPAYFIWVYYLVQALTQAGSNKGAAYETIRKIATDKIEKCEKLKASLGDMKSQDKKD